MAPQAPPKQPVAVDLIKVISGPRVDVFIGPRKKHYSLPKNLLCHFSEHFDDYINVDFNEGETHKIELPEDEVEEVALILEYMLNIGVRGSTVKTTTVEFEKGLKECIDFAKNVGMYNFEDVIEVRKKILHEVQQQWKIKYQGKRFTERWILGEDGKPVRQRDHSGKEIVQKMRGKFVLVEKSVRKPLLIAEKAVDLLFGPWLSSKKAGKERSWFMKRALNRFAGARKDDVDFILRVIDIKIEKARKVESVTTEIEETSLGPVVMTTTKSADNVRVNYDHSQQEMDPKKHSCPKNQFWAAVRAETAAKRNTPEIPVQEWASLYGTRVIDDTGGEVRVLLVDMAELLK
ncbi:uncharacterized protein PAC_04396 [Phialocephala subalpina]|uniref:BTB domain-containing protein n=1 Tax=Phialocephala subalpina TaxID=576137 RepID=A0A1L7WP16_9HELO|nr:uncharacterized protein PAC_04396 [Phialocephala subalpina]